MFVRFVADAKTSVEFIKIKLFVNALRLYCFKGGKDTLSGYTECLMRRIYASILVAAKIG